MQEVQEAELIAKYANMTNGELIHEHTYAWFQWKRAVDRFGQLGTPDRGELVQLMELEARKRGLPDDQLMQPIREEEEFRKGMPTPDSINAQIRKFVNMYKCDPNLIRVNKKTQLFLLAEFAEYFDRVQVAHEYMLLGLRLEVEYHRIPDGVVLISLELSNAEGK